MTASPLESLSSAVADIVEHAAPAVAAVLGRHGRTTSAFHWRDGLYVAAEEAFGHEEEATLLLASGKETSAEIVGRDPSTGVALLKSASKDGAAPALTAAGAVRTGNLVVAIGRTGDGVTAALGNVALAGPAWRSMRGGAIDRRLVLSVAAGLRYEGGPVLDARGGLVGMLLFGPRRRALVMPAETLTRTAEVLADRGYVPRGYLGAGLQPLRHVGTDGAIVLSVEPGGPAAQGGLLIGDTITTWNGEKLAGVRDLLQRLGPDSVGREVRFGIIRAGQETEVAVTIGARPHR